jgi:hypothetical protein
MLSGCREARVSDIVLVAADMAFASRRPVRNGFRQKAFFSRSIPWRNAMPAKSKAQQKAAGAALAAKRGEQKVSDLKGPAKSMYESMSEKQLDEFASTKRKGKPQRASKKN